MLQLASAISSRDEAYFKLERVEDVFQVVVVVVAAAAAAAVVVVAVVIVATAVISITSCCCGLQTTTTHSHSLMNIFADSVSRSIKSHRQNA